ncbi:hypothetical protein MIND_01120400 [Mycena indigotica]|uniref:Uncharacterized protein n=1 Tax=Mycena indigotica TaxID=2126181 RepID=A0A8H6VVH7_9AGAR|nr:uncharacterized protein MIND_01120400 [Mycena indigotica]KAF7293431.1 hypothetical protein MIND_01120400 [Mycena indigotica]
MQRSSQVASRVLHLDPTTHVTLALLPTHQASNLSTIGRDFEDTYSAAPRVPWASGPLAEMGGNWRGKGLTAFDIRRSAGSTSRQQLLYGIKTKTSLLHRLLAPEIRPQARHHSPPPLSVADRIRCGEQVLKKLKVSDRYQPLLRQFFETKSHEEREIITFVATVAFHEEAMALAVVKAEQWAPTSDQMKAIRKHSRVMLLLPELRFFDSASELALTAALLKSTRYGFPTEENDAAHDSLVVVCARQMSLAKNTLKTKVKESVAAQMHITQLVQDLVNDFAPDLSPTLALHHRIALMRMEIEKSHPNRKFWAMVDDELEALYGATPEEYVGALQLCYELDQERYPPTAGANPCIFATEIPSKAWIRYLRAEAKTVKRGQPRGQKRKSRDRDNSDSDEDGDAEPVGDGNVEPGTSGLHSVVENNISDGDGEPVVDTLDE